MAIDEQAVQDRNTLSDIPSRRETLAETLGQMFAVGNSGVWSVLIFALGVASLGWVTDSLLPVLHDLALLLAHKIRGLPVQTNFTDALIKLIVPLAWFALFIVILFWNARRNLRARAYETTVPLPHKGLIVVLSKYKRFDDKKARPAEIAKAIETNTLELDKVLSGCNWGHLAFVVRYHAPTLQQCWIIVTENRSEEEKDGSKDDYEQAATLIKFLTKDEREVFCTQVVITNPNDIGETAQAVSRIYRELAQTNSALKPPDVIANFTGGTAAMSGGMILATLDEGREIEYVAQGIALNQAITRQQVGEQKLIVSPRTSLKLAQLFARN